MAERNQSLNRNFSDADLHGVQDSIWRVVWPTWVLRQTEGDMALCLEPMLWVYNEQGVTKVVWYNTDGGAVMDEEALGALRRSGLID